MKHLNIEKATERYNKLMNSLALEHLTIGEYLSEDTEGWTVRDMVAECDYQLSTYYEEGHLNCELKEDGEYGRRQWYSEVGRLTRFIKAYEPFIDNFGCVSGHCSKYDRSEKKVELSFDNICKLFSEYEKEGYKVPAVGYIVFTEDSFDKDYDEKSRTYKFLSTADYFNSDKISNSLYGDCLDGTDDCVRLDVFIGKYWKIERCYVYA